MTGDGKPDNIRQWGKTGSALAITCDDETIYVPIYSNTGLEGPLSKSGEWVHIKHWPFISADSDSSDTFTWIDSELHLFDLLPFNSGAPEKLSIWFEKGRYTSDLLYCKAFDIYAPLYRLTQPEKVKNNKRNYLTLLLKSGAYDIKYAEQNAYRLVAEFPEKQHLNTDGIIDYKLVYNLDDGGSAGAWKIESTLLGCDDNTYIYAPDHQIQPLIKRGKKRVNQE